MGTLKKPTNGRVYNIMSRLGNEKMNVQMFEI